MKIKLAILDKDINYLHRIVTAFGTKYAEKLEIYSFTDITVALQSLDESKIDIMLASDVYEIDAELLPKRCAFAYFVDNADIETKYGQPTICKFQKADFIYKQILSIYSEKAGSISGIRMDDDSARIIIFSSPCGGVGTSTVAASCAVHFANMGKRTFYLNLERYGSADLFFNAEGQFDMSDVIFALKTRKANISMKLESAVRQDICGVCYYSQSKISLDMLELDASDIIRLISEIKLTGNYDYIIVDMDFSLDKNILDVYRQAHALTWVGDGSEISNNKILRAFEALTTKESGAEAPLTNRLSLLYNKFGSKNSRKLEGIEIKNPGGAPKFENASVQQIVSQLSPMGIFEKII